MQWQFLKYTDCFSCSLEVEIVKDLFKAEFEIQQWRMFPSLLLLFECQARLSSWTQQQPPHSTRQVFWRWCSYSIHMWDFRLLLSKFLTGWKDVVEHDMRVMGVWRRGWQWKEKPGIDKSMNRSPSATRGKRPKWKNLVCVLMVSSGSPKFVPVNDR